MLKFVQNVNFVAFAQLSSFVDAEKIKADESLFIAAKNTVKANRVVNAGFEKLVDILASASRPETVAIALSDALLNRSNEEQHHFVNSILGGFKLLADFYTTNSDRLDMRNIGAYQIMDNIINLGTPNAIDSYYKFGAIEAMSSSVVDECRISIADALGESLSTMPNANIMASIFFTAFRKQHPTHQQSVIRSLMATFYRLEDLVSQPCLKNKITHINTFNTPLAYC